MNVVVVSGRICKDVVVSQTNNGSNKYILNSIAVSKPSYNGEQNQVYFFNTIMFGAQCDNFAKFIAKGDKVVLNATLEANTYGEGNQKKTTYQLNIKSFELVQKFGGQVVDSNDVVDIFG